MYYPFTGKTVQFAVVQNYWYSLAELENEEVELNNELENFMLNIPMLELGLAEDLTILQS